jgi:hypothetical protein
MSNDNKDNTIEPWQLILLLIFVIFLWEGIKDGCRTVGINIDI